MIALQNLEKGLKAEIISFISGKNKLSCENPENENSNNNGRKHRNQNRNHQEKSFSRLESLGIRKGRIVEMIINENHGPIVIKIDGSRVAVGRGIAEKVIVEKI